MVSITRGNLGRKWGFASPPGFLSKGCCSVDELLDGAVLVATRTQMFFEEWLLGRLQAAHS